MSTEPRNSAGPWCILRIRGERNTVRRTSGTLVAATAQTITIEREVYDDWRCTSRTVRNTHDRRKILLGSTCDGSGMNFPDTYPQVTT